MRSATSHPDDDSEEIVRPTRPAFLCNAMHYASPARNGNKLLRAPLPERTRKTTIVEKASYQPVLAHLRKELDAPQRVGPKNGILLRGP